MTGKKSWERRFTQAVERLPDEPGVLALGLPTEDRVAVGQQPLLVVRAPLDRHAQQVAVLAELLLDGVGEGERGLPARPARPRRDPPPPRLVHVARGPP